MRKLLFLILTLILLTGQAAAYDVLILQGQRGNAFDEALKGFRAACTGTSRTLVLADYAEVDVPRIIREDHPRLVLAMGDQALAATRKVRQTPVVTIMALGLHGRDNGRTNVTGVESLVPVERYLTLFAALKGKRIGILMDPDQSGWYVHQAQTAAQQAGIELVVREVRHARTVPDALASLAGRVDLVWMLPDRTTARREVAEAYFHFFREQQIPVVSFAASYLGMGAAAVLDPDWQAIGMQAGEDATAILHGTPVTAIPVVAPRRATVKTNRAVLKHLGRDDLIAFP